MWNNGNNGNGQGYGQQGAYGAPQGGYNEDVYDTMNRARDQGGARFPYIEAGRHKLALVTLENFMHRTDGKSVRALFEVVESSLGPTGQPVHAPGSYVVKIFKINTRPKYESSLSDSEQLANMCSALKNAPKGYPIGRDIRTLLEERPTEQLARGSIVECTGVPNKKGNWVNLYWNPLPQTDQDIVQMRQRIEMKGVPQTNGNGSAQGGGQPPQQGYQQQQAPQQQYAPQQGYQMQQTQYGLPPGAQPGYGPTPGQQIQGAPNPAYYPNAPQGQPPQQGYQQQQPPQQGGAPQGGFLAQIPPQQGGGNGGNRW